MTDATNSVGSSGFNILVNTSDISHADWLSYRNLGIGGSDASVVCGINKWKSPVELYMEKKGMLPPIEAGEAAYWGNRLEDLVKGEFTLRTGIEVMPVDAILQSVDYPFMLANLDGYCNHPEHGGVIFEAKTAGQYMASEWGSGGDNASCNVGDDVVRDDVVACNVGDSAVSAGSFGNNDNVRIPDAYMLQLQHYMAVTGMKGAYIAVLIGGNDFRWQFAHRDEELIYMLIQLEQEFWDGVHSGTPPILDGSDASAKFLDQHFPDSISAKIELPKEAINLIHQYDSACEKIDEHEEQKQEAENLLKLMLGECESGVVKGVHGNGVDGTGDRYITWKTVYQERLDTRAIRSDHPTLCQKYTNTTSCRRFSVKSVN